MNTYTLHAATSEDACGSGAPKTGGINTSRRFSYEEPLAVEKTVSACFIAGTKILVRNGLKNIENIKIGDTVWAYNDTTKQKALQEVLSITTHQVRKIIKFVIGRETIITTPEHLFWIRNSWINAKDVNLGDSITLFSDIKMPVTGKALKDSTVFVYNFTVANFHTYYISSINVLVHNDCNLFTKAQKIASNAASKFTQDFSCVECSVKVIKDLKKEGLSGELVEIRTGSKWGNIWSDKAGKVISRNGVHRGVLVDGKVFDNLNPNGVNYDQWIKDIHTVTPAKVTKTKF